MRHVPDGGVREPAVKFRKHTSSVFDADTRDHIIPSPDIAAGGEILIEHGTIRPVIVNDWTDSLFAATAVGVSVGE